MLFTRTIRRKIMVGLMLVLSMLLTLSFSGLSVLSWYGDLIENLRFSVNDAPRKQNLVVAVHLLDKPLDLLIPDENEGAAQYQKREFDKAFDETRDRVRDFRKKFDQLPSTSYVIHRQQHDRKILGEIGHGLTELKTDSANLSDPVLRETTVDRMRVATSELRSYVDMLPAYDEGLHEAAEKAQRVYTKRQRIIYWSSVLVILLFLGLTRYAYVAIFKPLRTLHQGAQRVAQGDFDFRVEIATRDEMSELANSFNRMTARFQEITRHLDNQVRERTRQAICSEHLAGIGLVAASVAHEINNPLSAISVAAGALSLRHARSASPENEDDENAQTVREYLQMIERESKRCREITHKLLNLARGDDGTRRRNDLTTLITDVLSMARHMKESRGKRIDFNRTEPCYLDVNGPQITQVVLNLISNALASMDAGGILRIEVVEKMDLVCLEFKDEGCGMTPEVIDNIFEPFFTQQRDGRGTGLGMSISNRIVNDHGGMIEAKSDGPDRGSTFIVHLPRIAHGSEAAA